MEIFWIMPTICYTITIICWLIPFFALLYAIIKYKKEIFYNKMKLFKWFIFSPFWRIGSYSFLFGIVFSIFFLEILFNNG